MYGPSTGALLYYFSPQTPGFPLVPVKNGVLGREVRFSAAYAPFKLGEHRFATLCMTLLFHSQVLHHS